MAIITISRQYGSRGDEIAARVCELLGYRYFDKTLMAEMASELGLSSEEIVDFSEAEHRVEGFLERLFRGPRSTSRNRTRKEDAPKVKTLDEAGSIALVRAAVTAAYHVGNIVIVGRGSQVILKDRPGMLSIRVEAPLDTRI